MQAKVLGLSNNIIGVACDTNLYWGDAMLSKSAQSVQDVGVGQWRESGEFKELWAVAGTPNAIFNLQSMDVVSHKRKSNFY